MMADHEDVEPPDEPLLAAALAGTGMGIYLTDLAGRIIWLNPKAADLLGCSTGELYGTDAHEALHRRLDGSVPPRSSCELTAVCRHGRSMRSEFATFATKGGKLLPVAWLASPIRRHDEPLGAVVAFIDIVERLDAAGRQADQLVRAQKLTEQLRLLTEISTVLTQTLDVRESMTRLGRLLVPRVADWAAVDMFIGPRELRRLAMAVADGAQMDPSWFGQLPTLPKGPSRSPLVRVLRGEPALLLGPEQIAAPPDGPLAAAHDALFNVLGASSAIVAPLRTARRVLGALTVARTSPARPYTEADVELMADIARTAALAADNACLFGQQRDIVDTMQRHLLTALPQVDHLQLAARYLAAPVGSQVGGDWYDAFLLPDGVTALAIGDVAGHDLEAAGQMAQLRNMLRALACDHEDPPSLVLDRLNKVMAVASDAPTASVILARIESPRPEGPGGPYARQLRWTSAGHLPPLLVTAEGQARYLEEGQSLLLGVHLDDVIRHDATVPLPPGSTLLLYTDGLVEVPGVNLDTGLGRLRRHAAGLARHPIEDFCEQILTLAPSPRTDDIALLALRLPPFGQ
ncbi:MAG: SpoIIE family protein phosphatase [Nonomuraea sp.]|nr:SpoIIE family protein phosphatase [Nonomuraea sp.]NUP67605.1 SpoIIE family protein phosphatase [Nonomuraea sp.]NUP76875.1 SpoIIE family protein phosphatase [Nonomuraea sp.]